jgi:hypothetical protein
MKLNQKFLERAAIGFMVVGILCLCQPWIGLVHAWSVLIMLIGLIGFNIAAHLPVPPAKTSVEQTRG